MTNVRQLRGVNWENGVFWQATETVIAIADQAIWQQCSKPTGIRHRVN